MIYNVAVRMRKGRAYYATINGKRAPIEHAHYVQSVGHGLGRVDCFATREVDGARDMWEHTCSVHLDDKLAARRFEDILPLYPAESFA
jgi:hypothetical protein